MPRLLAIDTSTEACSVALLDGSRIVERFFEAPREHVQRLLPMIDELLTENHISLRDLDAIAFGCGPGSFTGLRICLGVVQGLAFGANLPVIPVSTLAALAQSAVTSSLSKESYLFSAIDARMDEIYCGWFRLGADGLVVAESEERVCAPELMPMLDVSGADCIGVGSGWNYAARMQAQRFADISAAQLPHAAAVAALALPLWHAGKHFSADEAQPVYLRNDVAWKKSIN
ncbi:MAG: tRNA ((37)-N6)-threonylcarbamoyltransferase complex dimerization subunit type 1 TsaB [Verrucomicrobiaceae bacterium]|nr:tRNA ((37)-N6)-threonylcarbamoyltransferase complex dimerization subunit type 1 TsaB [Verrucomicrobiaceae bacterium]